MNTLLNSRERTLSAQIDLCRQAGWRVERVKQNYISRFGYITARPM